VSAGFGGTPFGDAFTNAAPRSKVMTAANVMLFREPIKDTRRQIEEALAFKPTVVIGLDILFWDVYGGTRELEPALKELERIDSWLVIGDVPLITTANEMMLPKEAIPSQAELDAANARIRTWATRDRVLLVPLAEWTAPLRNGEEVTLTTGEKMPASDLMAIDGLHANALGTYYVLDKLDHYIEAKLPGTPRNAIAFKRPE
jgi:hypothetical protein